MANESDDFVEINGQKVYRKLFKDPDQFEKLKASQVGGAAQSEEAWATKREEEKKAALQEMTLPEKAKMIEAQKAQEKPATQAPNVLAPTQAQTPADQAATQAEENITQQQMATQAPAAPVMPPSAPTVMTPALIQETAISKVMQSPEAKQAVKAYQQATDASIVANQDKAKFEIERSNQLNSARLVAEQQREIDQAAYKKTVDEQNQVLADRMAKMQKTASDLANYKFQEFFEGREGARVMAGLSMAIGAVGASFTKGPNYAMEIINNAIQNDLARQKATFEKMKGTLEADQSLYGQLMKQFDDKNLATQTFMKIKYDQTISKAEAIAGKISDPEAQARIGAMTSQMKQEGAKAVMAATEGLKTTVQTQIKQAPKQMPGDIIKARADFEDRVKKSSVGDAISTQNAAEKFRAIVKAGASEEAIADFISGKGGLGQGSYSPIFATQLNSMGIKDQTVEGVRKFLKGGVNPELTQKIQNFLDATSIQAAQDAARQIPYIAQEAQLVGMDPDVYISQINQKGLKLMQYERAGARRISP